MSTDLEKPRADQFTQRRYVTSLRRQEFLASLRSGVRMLSRSERKRAVVLTMIMGMVNVVELGSVTAILLFVNLIIQPSSLQANRYLEGLYELAGRPDVSRFVTIVGMAVIVLSVASTMMKWLVEYALQWYATACQNRLANELLSECVHAPYSWFLSRNYASLTRLIHEDVVVWSRNLVLRVMQMVNSLLTVLMVLALVLVFSPAQGGGAIVAIGLLTALGFYITRPLLMRLAIAKREALDQTMLILSQMLAGVKDIKLSSQESQFLSFFHAAHSTVTSAHARSNIWQETPPVILLLLGQVTLVILALMCRRLGIDGGRLAAEIALLIIVTAKVIPAINGLSSLFGSLLGAFPFVDEIQKLRESIVTESQRVFQKQMTKPRRRLTDWHCITFEGVGYQYPDADQWALKDVHLSVERGLHYGVAGRSGSGKSTLIDLLVGLLEPTQNRLSVDGVSLQELEPASWRSRIGYVPQLLFVVDDTLRANVAFGVPRSEVNDAHVMECLRLANLGDLPHELEHGLDTRLGDRGLRLSGGQRQRVGIARALYKRPEILVFDEATSALDAMSEREILAALDNLHGRLTLIIIAHRLTTVEHCDQIFLLEEGRVVGQGSYGALKAHHQLFREMAAAVLEAGVYTS